MKDEKSLTLAIVLTIIPITDILGANWFYLGRTPIGIAKLVLFAGYIILGVAFELQLLVMLIMVLWWIVDIPLFASGKIRPK